MCHSYAAAAFLSCISDGWQFCICFWSLVYVMMLQSLLPFQRYRKTVVAVIMRSIDRGSRIMLLKLVGGSTRQLSMEWGLFWPSCICICSYESMGDLCDRFNKVVNDCKLLVIFFTFCYICCFNAFLLVIRHVTACTVLCISMLFLISKGLMHPRKYRRLIIHVYVMYMFFVLHKLHFKLYCWLAFCHYLSMSVHVLTGRFYYFCLLVHLCLNINKWTSLYILYYMHIVSVT